jgi:hypothetical protein
LVYLLSLFSNCGKTKNTFFLEKPDIYRSITFDATPTTLSGCDNSIFLVIPDWYANGCCRVLAQTLYLVIKIRLIKYRFLKSIFTLRGKKRSTIAIYKQSTPTFLSAISAIMFHDMSDHRRPRLDLPAPACAFLITREGRKH